MVTFLVGVAPVALMAAFVARALRPRPLTRFTFGAVAVLCALYALAWGAVVTDVGDADGFVDCWPNCSLLQYGVGVALSWSPILMAALVLATGAYLAARRK